MKHLLTIFSLFSLLLLQTSCKQDAEKAYQTIEKLGLATGNRQDTLFFGYYFKMPRRDFFQTCMDLNKKGLMTNGTGAEIVMHPQGFKSETTMSFYPHFANDKIIAMPMRFHYDTWSPWLRQFSADSLMPEAIRVTGSWFGLNPNQFIVIKDLKNKRLLYVNVTDNRRIVVFKEDEMYVKVKISDLTAQKEPLSDIK